MVTKKNKNCKEIGLIDINSYDVIKEAFQTTVTNINFATLNNKNKVIVITSSVQSEGKSTFISNLAISYLFDNKKVLLIDADNRRPSIHKIFNIENNLGLSNAILENQEYKKYINSCNGIDILTAGLNSPFPATLFNSDYFIELIKKTQNDYDIVLIDTPPVLAVSDTLIISKLTTGVLFLIAEDISKKSELKETMNQFKEKEINVIGAVVTRSKQLKNKYYKQE